MSLDTVLRIGHTLRCESKDKMRHYRFSASPKESKDYPTYWFKIVVDSNFSIDWNSLSILPEKERASLYYFVNSTADKDTSAPTYLFGDIYYTYIKNKENSKSYRVKEKNSLDSLRKNINDSNVSFYKLLIGEALDKIEQKKKISQIKDYVLNTELRELPEITNPIIHFWKNIIAGKDTLEKILFYAPCIEKYSDIEGAENKYKERCEGEKKKSKKATDKIAFNHATYIHFEFATDEGKNWYDQKSACDFIFGQLKDKILDNDNDRFVLNNVIYPALCSGNDKNDIQFPGFDNDARYKSFYFAGNEYIDDFLYSNAIMNKSRKWIKDTNVNIVVLPQKINEGSQGAGIECESLEKFFFDNKSESSLFSCDFLSFFDEASGQDIVCFDFVFVEARGNVKVYLFDIPGLQKSNLLRINNNLEQKANEISKEIKNECGWEDFRIDVERAACNVWGIVSKKEDSPLEIIRKTKDKDGKDATLPRYQSFMLKVVPRIYVENYYQDSSLLPQCIEQIETCIRNGNEQEPYNWFVKIKYSLKYLMDIQNNKESKYMEIIQSESFAAGQALGRIAQPLGKKINSFQKNYVGLLTRRVATKEDCIGLTNEIIEKLVMHECYTGSCGNVTEVIYNLKQYDKEQFTFGFFNGYFRYTANDSAEKFIERSEKLISDFSNTEDANIIEATKQLSTIVETLKQ